MDSVSCIEVAPMFQEDLAYLGTRFSLSDATCNLNGISLSSLPAFTSCFALVTEVRHRLVPGMMLHAIILRRNCSTSATARMLHVNNGNNSHHSIQMSAGLYYCYFSNRTTTDPLGPFGPIPTLGRGTTALSSQTWANLALLACHFPLADGRYL